MPKNSAYIIASNEANKVRATIEESARWADEIIVVDSWSTDGTADIATELGARVVKVKFNEFGNLRNNAIWQFPFKNMAEVLHKANRYSTLGAEKIKHQKLSMGSALRHGMWSFARHYFFKLGFLDGWAGFVIAFGNFEGTYYRYVKAIEAQQGAKWAPPQ